VRRFIDEHRTRFAAEPICRTRGVSASAYYQGAGGERCHGGGGRAAGPPCREVHRASEELSALFDRARFSHGAVINTAGPLCILDATAI
jgi:hypothetical protein